MSSRYSKYTDDRLFNDIMSLPVPFVVQDFMFDQIYRSNIRFDLFGIDYLTGEFMIYGINNDFDNILFNNVEQFAKHNEKLPFINIIKSLLHKHNRSAKSYITSDEYCDNIESMFYYLEDLTYDNDYELLWRYVWDVCQLELHEIAKYKPVHELYMLYISLFVES